MNSTCEDMAVISPTTPLGRHSIVPYRPAKPVAYVARRGVDVGRDPPTCSTRCIIDLDTVMCCARNYCYVSAAAISEAFELSQDCQHSFDLFTLS